MLNLVFGLKINKAIYQLWAIIRGKLFK